MTKTSMATRKVAADYLEKLIDSTSTKEFFQLMDCVSYVTGHKIFKVHGGKASMDLNISEIELAYVKQTVNELKCLKDLYHQAKDKETGN